MDIGGDLRRARTWRKLTIDDIAQRTKISPNILRAIESNQFDQVPSGLFARGFLRGYAREVHVDPEPLIERYRTEFEKLQPLAAKSEPVHAEQTRKGPVPLEEDGHGPAHALGLALVLLIGVAYVGYERGITLHSKEASKPADVTSLAVAAPVPVPIATSGSVEPPAQPPASDRLSFEIQATGECWVSVTADGERLVSRVLAAGEKQQFDVRQGVMLRVGDPGAFVFKINGAAGKLLGSAGVPVSVQMTRDNYKTFLASKPL